MKKSVGPTGSSFEDHLQDQLKDPEMASHYIAAAVEDNDPDYLKIALGRVVKAHGATYVSKVSGVGREAIYKMLSPDGNPAMSSIMEILRACGLAFKIVPENERALAVSSASVLDLDKKVSPRERPGVAEKIVAYIKNNGLQKQIALSAAGAKKTAKNATRRKAKR